MNVAAPNVGISPKRIPGAIEVGRFASFGSRLLLPAVFLLLLGLMLWCAKSYPYYTDDFYNFRKALIAQTHPSEIWKAYDIEPRRAPLAVLGFSWETSLFGFHAAPYLATLVFFHFLNAVLVGRLCKALGGAAADQLLCSLLFLCSSSFNQVVIHIIGTARVLSTFFMLLATLSWVEFLRRNRAWPLTKTFAFQTLAMGFNEGPMIFPLLAGLLLWQFPFALERPVGRRLWFSLAALGLWTAILLFAVSVPCWTAKETLYQLSGSISPLLKMESLAKALIVPLLVPPKGFFGVQGSIHIGMRAIPFFLALGVIVWVFARAKQSGEGSSVRDTQGVWGTGLGWILLAVLPYLLHPLGFEHTSRYLYFPAVGFSLIVGTIVASVLRIAGRAHSFGGKAMVVLGVAYILVINLASTAYHHQRYVNWVTEQRCSFYQEVRNLFARK